MLCVNSLLKTRMNLFINDTPVYILETSSQPDRHEFNYVINANYEPITYAKLLHRVWIQNAKEEDINKLIDLLDSTSLRGVTSLTLTVDNYSGIKKFVKKKFKIITAAGGLIKKGEKTLMIYRLKKWDLPKGKLDEGEKNRDAARREVEEECSVEVKVNKKICTTWHTYTMKKNKILKKTVWYQMDLLNDKKMKPQTEEDIEEVRWLTPKEVYHALQDSYKSISFVFDVYNKSNKG